MKLVAGVSLVRLCSPWRYLLVAALLPFACQVDDRTPGLASVADGAGEGGSAGGGSGMFPSAAAGSGGRAPNSELSEGQPIHFLPGLACDPIHPQAPRAPLEACAVGLACSAGPEGSRCRAAHAAAAAGASCLGDEDCGTGLFCGQSGQCRQYCIDSADCSVGVCGLFREPRFAGDLEVGFCSTGPCDPSNPQRPRETLAACPEGQACRAPDMGESYCEPAGSGQFQDPCSADSCAPGLFCGDGACNRYCLEAADCPSGGVCEPFPGTRFAGTLRLGFCASVCDPVHAEASTPPLTSCEAGLACDASDAGGSYCRRAGFGTLYSPCATNVDCAAGYVCNTNSNSCVQYCFGDEDCATGACNPFGPPLFAGARSVGSCAEICDPVSPQAPRAPLASCPSGFRCQAGGANGLSHCARGALLRSGASCTESLECAPGHACELNALTCRQYCYADADCDSGSCDEAASVGLAGTVDVFVCDL